MSDMVPVRNVRKGKSDLYANKAYGQVVMSAANTLTFDQILFGVGLFQGVALLLHRILWYPTPTSLRELVAASDDLQMVLTTTNRLTSIVDTSEPAIVAFKRLVAIGVAVATYELPLISDFSNLPGGGKLIPANPLFIGANTAGAAAASIVRCELEFSFIQLADREYMELLQTLFPANIS